MNVVQITRGTGQDQNTKTTTQFKPGTQVIDAALFMDMSVVRGICLTLFMMQFMGSAPGLPGCALLALMAAF